MTLTEVSRAGRRTAAVTALLCACAVLATGCGTRQANGTAAAVPSAVPATGLCEPLDLTSDVEGPVHPPTDEESGSPQPPTEEETGPPQPPTEEQTGPPQPPTDEETGVPGPPTDGDATPGAAVPCGAAGWYDMTREFRTYQAGHPTAGDPSVVIRQVRVRKVQDAGEALVVFATDSVGKGRGEDARALAQGFAAWRRQVYGDRGTVQLSTADGAVAATVAW
ncbi:hypothetical protein [Streptomyces sp. NPDC004050]